MKIKKNIELAKEKLGIQKLRKFQVEPIKTILNGEDVFVIAPTGIGKSAIFQVATLVRNQGVTLVIEPTLSLIRDQVAKLENVGIGVASLTGEKRIDTLSVYVRTEKINLALHESCSRPMTSSTNWRSMADLLTR